MSSWDTTYLRVCVFRGMCVLSVIDELAGSDLSCILMAAQKPSPVTDSKAEPVCLLG